MTTVREAVENFILLHDKEGIIHFSNPVIGARGQTGNDDQMEIQQEQAATWISTHPNSPYAKLRNQI